MGSLSLRVGLKSSAFDMSYAAEAGGYQTGDLEGKIDGVADAEHKHSK